MVVELQEQERVLAAAVERAQDLHYHQQVPAIRLVPHHCRPGLPARF